MSVKNHMSCINKKVLSTGNSGGYDKIIKIGGIKSGPQDFQAQPYNCNLEIIKPTSMLSRSQENAANALGTQQPPHW